MKNKYNSFLNKGFYKLGQILSKENCSDLVEQVFHKRDFGPKIFLDKEEYWANPKNSKVNPGPGVCNLAEEYNLDFILKNEKVVHAMEAVLGKNYRLELVKFVMSVPQSWIPDWLKEHLEKLNSSNNLNPYIHEKFQNITCYYGAAFHQDSIDYSGSKKINSKTFIVMYVYLDQVNVKNAPIHILPGSHMFGATVFPHEIEEAKDGTFYYLTDHGEKTLNQEVITGNVGTVNFWHSLTLHKTEICYDERPRLSLKFIFEKNIKEHCLMDEIDASVCGPILLENAYR